MAMVGLRDPELFRQITFGTEAELYKLKHKIYPKSGNNLGEGYSQFQEDSTRMVVLKKVKELIKKKAGLSGAGLMDRNERLLRALDDSVNLLKVNYKAGDESGQNLSFN